MTTPSATAEPVTSLEPLADIRINAAARADQLERQAETLESEAFTLRRQAEQWRAHHRAAARHRSDP